MCLNSSSYLLPPVSQPSRPLLFKVLSLSENKTEESVVLLEFVFN